MEFGALVFCKSLNEWLVNIQNKSWYNCSNSGGKIIGTQFLNENSVQEGDVYCVNFGKSSSKKRGTCYPTIKKP